MKNLCKRHCQGLLGPVFGLPEEDLEPSVARFSCPCPEDDLCLLFVFLPSFAPLLLFTPIVAAIH